MTTQLTAADSGGDLTPASSPLAPPPPPGRAARVLGIAATLLAAAAAIMLAAHFQREPPPAEAAAPGMTVGKDNIVLAPDAPQWKVLRLGAAQNATARWTDPLPARVTIDEARISRVGAPLAGRVSQVFVEKGQKVKAGQPLFSVSSSGLAELRAEHEKAVVDLKAAKANLERVQAVVAAHAVPAKEGLAAEQEYHQAEVAARLADAKISALRVAPGQGNGSDFTVVAPRDGAIVEKNLSVSQNVSSDAGEPLLVVADLSAVWVVADLFEADASDIKAGAAVRISSPSLPGVNIEGTVDMVSQVVDPVRHTIPVRVRVNNSDDALRPNVYAQVRFQTPAPTGAVEIAASAVMTDGVRSYVYLQDAQGRFVKHDVVPGSVRDGRVFVTTGLRAGDEVVEEGGVLLDNQIDLSN